MDRHSLPSFVDLKARQLEVLDHPLGQLLAGGIGDVLGQHPLQQVALLADREADRGDEQIAECSVIHGRHVLSLFRSCFAALLAS
jgi:hypothetical protein